MIEPGPRCDRCIATHPVCAGQVDPSACSLRCRKERQRRSAWESSLRGWPGPGPGKGPGAARARPWAAMDRAKAAAGGPRLGIGVITRNRLELLKECIAAIWAHTVEPYTLVVADDGSTDGTADWCASLGIAVITGERRGCAWNKNRALLALSRAGCDPFFVIEEDTRPVRRGWESAWIRAAQLWGHVNACYEPDQAEGSGTPEDPKWGGRPFGQWHAITRAELDRVGYLDSRFWGYGWEHVAWSWRFARENPDGWRPGKLPLILPEIGGVEFRFGHKSHFDKAEDDANLSRYWDAINAPLPCPFAHTPELADLMEREYAEMAIPLAIQATHALD